MSASGATILAIALVALLWLGIAVAIAIAAGRRFRLAEQVLEAAQANARLLELTPARPLLVRHDNSVEADRQLLRDLGLQNPPTKLNELAGNDSGIAFVASSAQSEERVVELPRTVVRGADAPRTGTTGRRRP